MTIGGKIINFVTPIITIITWCRILFCHKMFLNVTIPLDYIERSVATVIYKCHEGWFYKIFFTSLPMKKLEKHIITMSKNIVSRETYKNDRRPSIAIKIIMKCVQLVFFDIMHIIRCGTNRM